MTTALVTHPACLGHEPPYGHPERRERLETVLKALQGEEFGPLKREVAPKATIDHLALVHDRAYVEAVLEAIPQEGYLQLDADTMASPGSGEAILRAAGAAVRAVDLVLAGDVTNAFCAVRPPGHHALANRAMGFCLFNNIAVGAAHARAAHGLRRIAVVDFDVHHGNGTQAMFENDSDLFYASTHQSPLYPGTGSEDETGVAGNIVNRPLPPGADGTQFLAAVRDSIMPALERFRPQLILISAGFDAHRADPLAGLRLVEDDYAAATESLCALAARVCDGRVVSTLEGGYDLEATALSAAAHVRTLMAA